MSTTPVEFHVSVTQENIVQGEPANGQSCPVALALWQMYSIPYSDIELQIKDVTVGSESIDLIAGGYEFVADVPENIQLWIDAFDSNDPDKRDGFLPVEFDLKFYCTNIDEDEDVPF
jgi:hypothetical protein